MGMNMPDENDKFSIEHFNTNTQALDIVGKPDEYKNTKTYAVGDLCIHNNILYKCITAVETAEEFNAEKWEVTSLCKEEIANKTAIAELTEKTLIHVDRQPSLKPAMNTITKLSEYGNLPNGKYRVVARAQILNIYPIDMQSWLIIAPSNITPETGFDNGISFPANTSYSSVQMEQPIDITNEAKEINVYMYTNVDINVNLRVWIYKI